MRYDVKRKTEFSYDLMTRLNMAMKDRDYSIYRLSDETVIPEASIRSYVYGTSIPGGYAVMKMCRALGISADWLLGLEDAT